MKYVYDYAYSMRAPLDDKLQPTFGSGPNRRDEFFAASLIQAFGVQSAQERTKSFDDTFNHYMQDLTNVINYCTTITEMVQSDPHETCRTDAFALKDTLTDMNSEMYVKLALNGYDEEKIALTLDAYEENIERREEQRKIFLEQYKDLLPTPVKKEYYLD